MTYFLVLIHTSPVNLKFYLHLIYFEMSCNWTLRGLYISYVFCFKFYSLRVFFITDNGDRNTISMLGIIYQFFITLNLKEQWLTNQSRPLSTILDDNIDFTCCFSTKNKPTKIDNWKGGR